MRTTHRKTNATFPFDEQSEIYAIFHARLPEQARLAWDIALYTGLRISDIIKLRYPAPIMEITEQKTGKKRIIHLSPELVNRAQHAMYNGWVFASPRWDKDHICRSSIQKSITETAQKLGISGIGLHSARKMYAIALFRMSGDLFTVQKQLNHKNVGTTLLYLYGKPLINDNSSINNGVADAKARIYARG